MPESGSGFERFFRELKRRRVLRVAGVYIVAGLAVVEGADLILPRLALPDWTVTLVVALVLLGFPLAVGVAWAFDITPEGVQKAQPSEAVGAAGADGGEARPRRGRDPPSPTCCSAGSL